MKIFKKAKRGFTLVELVVVIAVIAILAAVSVGAYFGVTESANNSRLEQETKQLHTAIQTISLGTHENQSLGSDGLRVNDIDQFELDLEASTGQEFEVLTNDPGLLSRQTIVLKTGEFQAANGASILYKTFEYYNPEISGKKVIASTIDGDFKIEKIDSIPVDYEAEDVTNNLVHVVNEAGWSDVYVYAWRTSDEVKNANWPGVPMVNLGGNIYAYYLTSTFDKVIFNNNSGAQTPDLDVPSGDEPNYYNNSTKTWGNEPSSDVLLPEIEYKDIYYASYWENPKIHAWAEDSSLGYFDKEMELVSGNLYKVEVPVTYNKGLIFRDTTEKLQTSDILFTGYDAEGKVLWNGTEWTTTSNLPTFEIKTMYAILSDEYTTPHIYTWGNDSRYKLNWPGLAMVKVENNDYNIWGYSFIDVPTNMKINNNDADPQTDDLSFAWTAEKPYYDLAQNAWISVPGETAESGSEQETMPQNMYIIGSFGTSNWSTGTEMTGSDEGQTWTVTLSLEEGDEFKLRDNSSDWGIAGTNNRGYGIAKEETTYFGSDDPDNNNSNIKVLSSFVYTLEFDFVQKKLTVLGTEPIQTEPTPEPGEGGEEPDPNPQPSEKKLYLLPNSNWKESGARFAAYFFVGDTVEWVDMTDTDTDGIYETTIPTTNDYTNVIFCRMNPSVKDNIWDNKWNQTVDLTIPLSENNTYIIPKGGWDCGKDDATYWMTLDEAKSYEYPADSLPSNIYVNFNEKWTGSNFGAWIFESNDSNSPDKFVSATDTNSDGIYEVSLEPNHTYKKIIFVQFNNSTMNWDNKKQQTGNLDIPTDGRNMFVFNDGDGYWTLFE